jgi:hypothetical protein
MCPLFSCLRSSVPQKGPQKGPQKHIRKNTISRHIHSTCLLCMESSKHHGDVQKIAWIYKTNVHILQRTSTPPPPPAAICSYFPRYMLVIEGDRKNSYDTRGAKKKKVESVGCFPVGGRCFGPFCCASFWDHLEGTSTPMTPTSPQ